MQRALFKIANPVFLPYFGQGVTAPSEILHDVSTSEVEYTSQKTGKNYAYAVCTKPYIFPNLGAPISGQGVDIRMLSPPSDRGWRRLKIWSDANFSYGHSKRISSGGEKFLDFRKNGSHVWGACAQPPLHRE